MNNTHFDIIIVGGGLAGLTCALHLSKKCGILVIEKQTYPHHKVCGEYISNEVLPYLRRLGVDPIKNGAKEITEFEISTENGRLISSQLPLGGFGISRYALDQLMYKKAKNNVNFYFDTVNSIQYNSERFLVKTLSKESFSANFVVGAFGKRSNLDGVLKRNFFQKKSNWLAVKAHYSYDFPANKVALHNFKGGYCGLSKTENGFINACYLTSYKSFKPYGNIAAFQEEILTKNKHLKHFLKNATPVFDKPLTISQISFEEKEVIYNHIFMVGDSAGLIHPLCGNGMAMAIHSAKLFAECYLNYIEKKTRRFQFETKYEQLWRKTFSKRLATGRRIQKILLQPKLANVGYSLARLFPSIVPNLIKKTHGELLQ